MCNPFTCCSRNSHSKDQSLICQSIKAKWWKFKQKQKAESQTPTCGSDKRHLSWGLLSSSPAVSETRVRSTPHVADSRRVALDDLTLLRDPCEKCNLIDFPVLFSLTPRDGAIFSLTWDNPFAAVVLRKSSISPLAKTGMESWQNQKSSLAWGPKVPSDGWGEAKWGEWGVSACPQSWTTLKPNPTAFLTRYKENSTEI